MKTSNLTQKEKDIQQKCISAKQAIADIISEYFEAPVEISTSIFNSALGNKIEEINKHLFDIWTSKHITI